MQSTARADNLLHNKIALTAPEGACDWQFESEHTHLLPGTKGAKLAMLEGMAYCILFLLSVKATLPNLMCLRAKDGWSRGTEDAAAPLAFPLTA